MAVTDVVANDISGQGQMHFGALKKPTGDNLTDVTKQGFQPSGIDEGVIFSSIFEEDSTGGCISLAPGGAANASAVSGAAAVNGAVVQVSSKSANGVTVSELKAPGVDIVQIDIAKRERRVRRIAPRA